MNECYLLIGGNLGDREKMLETARLCIGSTCGQIKGISRIYETEPWGIGDQPHYLNQAMHIISSLSPDKLLEEILNIERSMGRERTEKYGARTIDIDILYHGSCILQTETLVIPHPRIHERRFVLVPMSELAPGLMDPIWKLTIKELLENCQDPLEVNLYSTELN